MRCATAAEIDLETREQAQATLRPAQEPHRLLPSRTAVAHSHARHCADSVRAPKRKDGNQIPWPARRVVQRRTSSRSTEVTAELAPICNASQSALSDACVSWHPDERPLNSFPCPGEARGTNQCAWRRLRGLLFCMAAPAREWPPLKTKYCGCWHDRCWHTPPLVDAVPTLLCW